MNTKTLIAAVMASIFAVSAAAPSQAAGDPVKKEKKIQRMIKRADLNRDNRISRTELAEAVAGSFAVLDANRDGVLTASEAANRKAAYKAYRIQAKASRKAGQPVRGVIRMPKAVSKKFAKIDANGDGVISLNEIDRIANRLFKRHDRNRDGYISAADFKV